MQPLFPSVESAPVLASLCHQNVQTSRALERGTMGDIEKPAAILQGVLAVPSAILSGIEVDARSNWSLTSPIRTLPSKAPRAMQ